MAAFVMARMFSLTGKMERSFGGAFSSHRRCSAKKGVLKNFANFTGKQLCWNLFIKKRLQHRYFTLTFLRASSFKNICESSFFKKLARQHPWNDNCRQN